MSQLNPSEISSVLKEKIAGLDLSAERKNEGIVVSVSDGIVRIHGMGDVMYGEVIEFENGTKGMALNLEQDSVGAVVLGDYLEIIEGQKAVCTGKVLEVPVGEAMLGRVVNTLGAPIDGKGEIKAENTAPVEVVAPGVIARQSVDQPVQIGLKAVDAMVPIGLWSQSVGVKESLSLETDKQVKQLLQSTQLSTKRELALNVFMLLLVKNNQQLQTLLEN